MILYNKLPDLSSSIATEKIPPLTRFLRDMCDGFPVKGFNEFSHWIKIIHYLEDCYN